MSKAIEIKLSVRPWLGWAWLIVLAVSMLWSAELSMLFFDVEPEAYISLMILDRFNDLLIIAITCLWIFKALEAWSNRRPRPSKREGGIYIREANLVLDSDTLAPYQDDILAMIRANAMPKGVSILEAVESKGPDLDFAKLYEAAEKHDQEIRDSCTCGPDARAECLAWKKAGGV